MSLSRTWSQRSRQPWPARPSASWRAASSLSPGACALFFFFFRWPRRDSQRRNGRVQAMQEVQRLGHRPEIRTVRIGALARVLTAGPEPPVTGLHARLEDEARPAPRRRESTPSSEMSAAALQIRDVCCSAEEAMRITHGAAGSACRVQREDGGRTAARHAPPLGHGVWIRWASAAVHCAAVRCVVGNAVGAALKQLVPAKDGHGPRGQQDDVLAEDQVAQRPQERGIGHLVGEDAAVAEEDLEQD
jgi:hypothetical protein